jgi:hypothetical protein
MAMRIIGIKNELPENPVIVWYLEQSYGVPSRLERKIVSQWLIMSYPPPPNTFPV